MNEKHFLKILGVDHPIALDGLGSLGARKFQTQKWTGCHLRHMIHFNYMPSLPQNGICPLNLFHREGAI